MSQDYENNDDYRKVFVSRLPLKWKDEMLKQHFESCFGGVESASINWDKEGDFSLGYGFVTFLNEDGCKVALEQGSMHVQRKIIQIRPVTRDDSAAGRGRDSGVCFLWQKRRCVKGDSCKFTHEGEGACVAVADPYHGLARRKCLSFKSKGKCSKGDKCPFLHIAGGAKESVGAKDDEGVVVGAAAADEDKDEEDGQDDSGGKNLDKPKGVCHSFKKKGKCRKGDKCKFSHSSLLPGPRASSVPEESSEGGGKRKRIDGSLLVKNRKKLLLQTAQQQEEGATAGGEGSDY